MISIIIPFNNGKKYLDKCLENLSKIEYNDYEIILVDDYSNDNSEIIANKYEKTKYYYTTQNTIGVGNARNLGIDKAKGKYIMFVDVDDTVDKNINKELKQYIDEDIDMIKYKMKIIKGKKEILTTGNTFEKTNGQDAFNRLCYNDKFFDSPCLYLIKKDLFNKLDLKFEENVYHEDFGLIPQLIVNSQSVVSTNFYGYNYYQSENSIMRNGDYSKRVKKVEDKFLHYNNLLKNIKGYKITDETRENLLTYYTNSIILAIKELNVQDRKKFEKRLKDNNLFSNINPKNLKQYIKKWILENNIELYFKLQNVTFRAKRR